MMKLINTVLMLVIVCVGLHSSQGEKLKCEFKDVGYHVVGILYSCYVTSLDNFFNNMTIDGYTGTHNGNKNDTDVKAIWIHGANTKYIPANLGFLFNLSALTIQRSQLIEIKSKDFHGMKELNVLSFNNNSLTSVPSDAFSTLPKLKCIILSENQISNIPSGLFTANVNLVEIYLYNNKIKFIGSGLFDVLTTLHIVDLRENICEINEDFIGSVRINELKKELKSKCKNTNDPHEIIFNLKQENDKLLKEKTTLMKEYAKVLENERQENSKLRAELLSTKEQHDETIKIINEREQVMILDFTTKLFNCQVNQQNLTEHKCNTLIIHCEFLDTDGVYSCMTRDLIIYQKDMKLNTVSGTHLESNSNGDVTELLIVNTALSYWSNDIHKSFPALKILGIQNAQLNQLTKGDFSSAFNLTVLVVNGNDIKSLGDEVFHGTEEHLTDIDLNSNKIEKLSSGTFHGLKHLKVLSLKDNLIIKLQLGLSKDVVMLENLILTGNKIKFLHGKLLKFNTRLITFAVDHNKIREIGEDILDYSVMLKDVHLEDNDCIDEGTNEETTIYERTRNDLIFVIKNCCKNPAEALNVYNCGYKG